ncbi:SMI1/KNR4 family protein [Tundrisphaera sp. TA3]|uniref:SMI1/KNR4 family protein n=1 Tax=Tundrisphaera sp. TA3 TaxID=3435775 RepID=UPI003EB84F1F
MQAMGDLWTKRWQRAIDAAKRRGARDYGLEIDRPATTSEVEEVERAIGRPLPQPFRRTLLEFSRRVDFFWFLLPQDDQTPERWKGVWCGGCRWDIGQLARMDEEARWLSTNAFVEDTPDETIWRDKLPFHAIASGDYIAIDVSSGDPQPVVYLSHDFDYSHGHVLGGDFFDFMDRWTALGCPDDDIWPLFVPEKRGGIDLAGSNAVAWCEWFGVPPGHAIRDE